MYSATNSVFRDQGCNQRERRGRQATLKLRAEVIYGRSGSLWEVNLVRSAPTHVFGGKLLGFGVDTFCSSVRVLGLPMRIARRSDLRNLCLLYTSDAADE